MRLVLASAGPRAGALRRTRYLAPAAGRRLAGAHVVFNVLTGLVAIAAIVPLAALVDVLARATGIAPDDWTLKLALPVLLLVSASMGFVVKTVPQINILVVGFPIQIAVGLAVIGLSLVFFGRVLSGLFLGMEEQLGRVLAALSV